MWLTINEEIRYCLCLVLSCLVVSCRVVSCLVVSCLVLSCFSQSFVFNLDCVACLVWSCLVFLPCLCLVCSDIMSCRLISEMPSRAAKVHADLKRLILESIETNWVEIYVSIYILDFVSSMFLPDGFAGEKDISKK